MLDDLKYEKKSIFSKLFSKLKKEKQDEVQLPDLAKDILSRNESVSSSQKVQNRQAQQALPKINIPSPKPIPSLQNQNNQSNSNSARELPTLGLEQTKKVDISKVQSEQKQENMVYVEGTEKDKEIANNVLNINENNQGFFLDLMNHLQKEENLLAEKKSIKSEILNKNLLSEMKESWQIKKEELMRDVKNKEEKERVLTKVKELQELELKWQEKELSIQEYKKEMEFLEQVIEEKSIELKKIIKSVKYSENAKNPFVMNNGKVIKNIKELSEVLKVIDNATFNEHVNEFKNDFSEWVLNEFNDETLSNRIKDSYSKDDLIAILELF